jgi:hypothetical protein
MIRAGQTLTGMLNKHTLAATDNDDMADRPVQVSRCVSTQQSL